MRPAVNPGFTGTALFFAAAMLTCEGVAGAEEVEEARELYLEADFPGALEAFNSLLESESLDLDTALEAHRYLAALFIITEDADNARRHAEAAVAIEPDVTAPEGAPPELGELFEEVRSRQGDSPATLTIEAGEEGLARGRDSIVMAELAPSPAALASRINVWCSGDVAEAVDTTGEPPRVELTVRPDENGRRIRCGARAETGAGAVMVEAEQELEVTGRRRRRRSGRRVWPWALGFGGGAVLVGVIAAVAVVASRPDDAFIGVPQVDGW